MNTQVVDRQNPARPIRVVAAEDSYVIREFLVSTLDAAPEIDLVAVCSNRNELDRAIDSLHPDVLVTDIRMPPTGGDEGIAVAARLRETDPNVGVVVLSQYAEPEYAVALFEAGSARPRLPAQGADPKPPGPDRRGRGRRPWRVGDRPADRRSADPGARPRGPVAAFGADPA